MSGGVYKTSGKVEEDFLCESCLAEKYDVDMNNYRSYVKEMSVEPCEICGYPEK